MRSDSSVTRKACLTVLDHLFRCTVTWLAPMLCFTAEEAWLARDPAAQLGASRSLPDRAAILARRRARREMAQGAQRAPRRHRRARNRARGKAHRLLARSRARSSMSPTWICSARWSMSISPNCASPRRRRWSRARGRPTAFRLDDVRGVAVVPQPRRGQEMRALVENLARGRRRSAISRRHAARRPGVARMGRHAQGGGVGGFVADAARERRGPQLCLGIAERDRAGRRGGRLCRSTRPQSFGSCTASISPAGAPCR